METANLYTPELYQFKLKGKNVVLDVMTSRIFAVDNIAYDILAHAHQSTIDNVISILSPNYSGEEIISTINEFKQARLLQENPFDLPSIKVEFNAEHPLKNFDFILSQDCNLRCRYCFADTGAFQGKRSLMSADVAKSAIDFMIQRSGSHKDLIVTFFGGEPTVNIPVLKQTIEYAETKASSEGKNFRFSISTNGTLMKEDFIQYLHSKKVRVQVSIDGDEETQNHNRPYKGNQGTYSDVKENVSDYFRITGHDIQARATLTPRDMDKFVSNIFHLMSMGFFSVHMEAASETNGNGIFNEEKDIQTLIEQFEKMSDIMLEKIIKNEYLGFDNFIVKLRDCHRNGKRLYGCGIGRGYLSVDGVGNIYPCHRFVGNDKFIMGNVLNNTYDPHWEKFVTAEVAVTARKSCSSCWARFFCGGDCVAHNEEKYGDMLIPDPLRCTLMKRIIELSLMIYAHITKEQKPNIEKIYNLTQKKQTQPVKQEQG